MNIYKHRKDNKHCKCPTCLENRGKFWKHKRKKLNNNENIGEDKI